MMNLADSKYCNDVWRVSHLHLSSSIYCNTFRIHMSELHPLHHIMRYHCEGTVPLNLVTYKKAGKHGLPVLLRKGIMNYEYGKLSYNQIMNVSILFLVSIPRWVPFQWLPRWKHPPKVTTPMNFQEFSQPRSKWKKKSPGHFILDYLST